MIKRVVLVLGTTSGGIGAHVRTLAAGLAARGTAVSVIGPNSADARFGFSALPGAAFAPVEFGDRPRLGDFASVLRLRAALTYEGASAGASEGRPVDAVHAHGLRAGAFAVLLVVASGILIWWPGSKTWRRSVKLPRGVGWKRAIWHLHSMIGFWSFAFALVFGFSGIYLCFPERVQDIADRLQPMNPAHPTQRLVDQIIYWLAYLHFGRMNCIGIPCRAPGLCDQTVKATWALFGLAPAVLFVTGAILWWNRVLRARMPQN